MSLIISLLLAAAPLFSWGDSDTRYPQDRQPEPLAKAAFNYPAWRGERVFAQAVLYSGSSLENVRLSASDLRCGKAVIPASNVEISPVGYVMADPYAATFHQCGVRIRKETDSLLVADRLDKDAPVSVSAGNTQPFWLKVSVPEGAIPGRYKGTVKLTADGIKARTLPLELVVLDRLLPEPKDWSFHLDLWQNPYSVARYDKVPLWSKEHFEAMRPVMKLLADAGQKSVTATLLDRPWNGQTEDPFASMVTKILKADGTWLYDYTAFDMWVSFMEEIGIDGQINCYTIIPWALQFDYLDQASGKVAYVSGDVGSEQYVWYWKPFLADFARHLREKGWLDKTYIAMDERPKEDMIAALSLLRSVDPRLKVSLAGYYHEEYQAEIADLCITTTQVFPSDVRAERKAAGKISTFYTCCAEKFPNTFMVSPPVEAVWIPLYAAAAGFDGYLRWAYNSWTADPVNDARFRTWTSGDCYLVYPDGRSSIRFDKLVEGIQLFEKAQVLKREWKDDPVRTGALEQMLAAFSIDATKETSGACIPKDVAAARALLNCR